VDVLSAGNIRSYMIHALCIRGASRRIYLKRENVHS